MNKINLHAYKKIQDTGDSQFFSHPLFRFAFIFLFLASGCTGNLMVEPTLTEFTTTGLNGIELDEYIPPGIQFLVSTSQGMSQEGFPYLKNNRVLNIKWIIKVCDPLTEPTGTCPAATNDKVASPDPGFYVSKIDYSPDNGTTWRTIPGATNMGGAHNQVQSFAWSIPQTLTDEGNQFLFRLTTINASGAQFIVNSSAFTMDNTPPVITPGSLKFNGSADSPLMLKSPGISIDFAGTDNLSPIRSYCLKQNTAAPLADDSCWIDLTSLGLKESLDVQIKNLKKLLGWVGGSYSYFFWLKDRSGNISVLSNETGDSTIDTRTISYSPGKAVYYTKSFASNSDMTSVNPPVINTIADAAHNTIYIKWNYKLDSGSQLDSTAPFKIEYSTTSFSQSFVNLETESGGTLSDTDISNSVDQNCTPLALTADANAAHCFVWQVPPKLYGLNIFFRIHVKDSSGFVYSVASTPLNLGSSVGPNNEGLGLRFVAGTPDTLVGASALSMKFNIDQNLEGGKLVVHEDGRIFVYDSTYGVMVINPSNGQAQVYLKLSSTSTDGIAVDTPNLLKPGEKSATISNVYKISLDYKGRLLIMEGNRIRRVTDEYDAQGNLTGRRTLTTIVGCTSSACYYDGLAKSTALKAKTPIQYWQNAWLYANEFDFKGAPNSTIRYFRHFTPLPNGDIYFSVNTEPALDSTVKPSASNSYRGLDFRIYRPDEVATNPGKIYPLTLGGSGVRGAPFTPISSLYPSSMGGIAFNPLTGSPTTLHMRWELCPAFPQNNQCSFYTSNHNPKTGLSNGTGTHYFSQIESLMNQNPTNWSVTYWYKLITSRRGELYAIGPNNTNYALTKLNTSTNKFVAILGGSAEGYCPDGTLATSCNVRVRDAWISQDNTVYFLDGFQIRMIGSDGRVATLFGRKTGDRSGEDATLSTLGSNYGIGLWTDSVSKSIKIIIKESTELILREFSIDGNIQRIAGNESNAWNLAWKGSTSKPGYSVSTSLANTEMGYWHGGHYINPPAIVNPTNGEIFGITADTLTIQKLIRTENLTNADRGRWLRILGGGTSATPLFATTGVGSCDGKLNTQCRNDWSSPTQVMAFIPQVGVRPAQILLLTSRNTAANIWSKYYMKLVDAETGLMTHFAGNDNQVTSTNNMNNFFPNSYSSTPLAASNQVPFLYQGLKYSYDADKDALIVGMYGTTQIGEIRFNINSTTNLISSALDYFKITDTVNPVAGFAHTFQPNSLQSKSDVIYYCGTNSLLYRRVISNSGMGYEIQLPLPKSMNCSANSRSIEVVTDENTGVVKLYFPVTFNGQTMIGEYSVPLQL